MTGEFEVRIASKSLRRDGQRNYVITADRPTDRPSVRHLMLSTAVPSCLSRMLIG